PVLRGGPGEIGSGPFCLCRMAVDANEECRVPALELELLAGVVQLGLAVEAAEDPSDRRLAALADGPRDDQAVDRARHRDVVEAQPLLVLGRALPLPVGVAQRQVRLARVGACLLAARVGDD